MNKQVKKILNSLKSNEITVFEVPEEYMDDVDIVNFERENDMREYVSKGYDVISNNFFVKERLISTDIDGITNERNHYVFFGSFDDFYDYIDGDLYTDACYRFLPLERISSSKKYNYSKMISLNTFVEETIEDYSLSGSKEELKYFDEGKKRYTLCQKWIEKFNDCNNYAQLRKMVDSYSKTKLSNEVDISFFFFNYIFKDVNDKQRFDTIMQYVSSGIYPSYKIADELCYIYNPKDVLQAYNYSSGAKSTIYRYKKKMKDIANAIENNQIDFHTRSEFDKDSHFYVKTTFKPIGYSPTNIPPIQIDEYFESFDGLVDSLNGDLTNCDLSNALDLNVDFSKYKTDETTKFPLCSYRNVRYVVSKKYENEIFVVKQEWIDSHKNTIKEYEHRFKYFFDFASFLNNDLSGADLLQCNGLINLKNISGLNLSNAMLTSDIAIGFGLPMKEQKINQKLINSFEEIENNEINTLPVLQEAYIPNKIDEDIEEELNHQEIYYISDLHLMHKIEEAGCKYVNDIIVVVQKIVNIIANEAGSILLINGDVSSEFSIFKLFVELLAKNKKYSTNVIFTLGNHELWSFPDMEKEQIIETYRKLITENGMYLLHNDIIYRENDAVHFANYGDLHAISYSQIESLKATDISEMLHKARLVIWGGLGFSGCNSVFNANKGIYRGTINRKEEIKESKIFENTYNKIVPILENKNTIILTHTPIKDWNHNSEYHDNFVYVYGHNHNNYSYDDGINRIYANNQIGYHSNSIHLKKFYIDSNFDYFEKYSDGIHEISASQYKDFYCGKNISISFNRNVYRLYMLKKNKHYCFIHMTENGNLYILNGGAIKKLDYQDINYYYDYMDIMISQIKDPFDKYTKYQKKYSDAIRLIGGSGRIHGCIVDIDFYNHIYVNPYDLTATAYWASDIINKKVYSSIPKLLENECPEYYKQYIKLLNNNSNNPFAVTIKSKKGALTQTTFETNIYSASYEIKKMQKLNSGILSSWYEDLILKRINKFAINNK